MILSGISLRSKLTRIAVVVGLALVLAVGIVKTEADPVSFVRGVPNLLDYLGGMFPPNWKLIPKLTPFLLESFWIAVTSIFWSVALSMTLGLLAARNVNRNRVSRKIFQTLISMFRSTHPMVYALVFVSAVGLGPFAGVLGLVFHTSGALGRYFSEAIETVPTDQVEAAQLDGAGRFRIIVSIILPDRFPWLLGYTMYYFEYCIRQSTMLGLVGAGGIGRPLMTSLRLFKAADTSAILLTIMVIVISLDTVVTRLRKKAVGEVRKI